MSTLKKLLMAATVLTAVTGSAHAEVVNKQWNMDYFPEVFNGACIAGSHYEKTKVTLYFGKIYRDGTTKWVVMLRNKSWPTKVDGEYEVVMFAGKEGAPKSTLKTLTKVFFGLEGGGLVVNDLSADEMNTLAFDGDATVWFVNKKDNKVIASLNINKSAEAIRALGGCLKAHMPNNTNTTKAPPTTPKKEDGGGFGTGFFVAPKQVLTSAHVVKSCNAIYIKYPTYKAVQAYVVSFDAKNDLALLKTDLPHDAIATFRTRGKLGEFVASYGFPYGNMLSTGGNFTTGGLTALRGMDDDSSMIQISAPLQPGNSGGPLMDSTGAVVGVSKAILTVADGRIVPQNVNFGVSAGTVITFLGAANIDVEIASLLPKLEPEKIAEVAQKYTVQVMCNN
jgi:serine protease Do